MKIDRRKLRKLMLEDFERLNRWDITNEEAEKQHKYNVMAQNAAGPWIFNEIMLRAELDKYPVSAVVIVRR